MGASRVDVVETMALTTQYLQEYMDMLSPEELDMAARFYADLGKAPVVIAISVPESDDPGEREHDYISVGAAIENFMLAALDEGLGSCSVSAPHMDRRPACGGLQDSRAVGRLHRCSFSVIPMRLRFTGSAVTMW